jgi:hypothetical protein
MKIAAIHDADGRIESLVVRPSNAPSAAVTTERGQGLTEVEAPDLRLDLAKAESLEQLAARLQRYRVRRAGGTARLVTEE